ncbi:MAG: hypothetical protein GQ581_05130 [Methyloprofundus sp.]|nr:hypothetical protein [Methyloprofundus sp.]
MQRASHITPNLFTSPQELHKHIAFHEAGHVAAIYLRNQQLKLPPVFFQIIINKDHQNHSEFFAKIEGGRLVENLPVAEIEHEHLNTEADKRDLQQAYEADVVNLLVGPLAEAKFVALCDGEMFNLQLINLAALTNYGGHSDLEVAQRYLKYFISDAEQRELRMQFLFAQAFEFINHPDNWKCIHFFAHYLLDNEQTLISCEQASSSLEEFLAA